MAKMLSNFVRFLCKKHGFAQLNKVNFEPNTAFFVVKQLHLPLSKN